MKNTTLKIILIAGSVLTLLVLIYFYITSTSRLNKADSPTLTVCTEEAKICSDGSVIVRTGTQCQFPACPTSDELSADPEPAPTKPKLTWPLTDGASRVTKKPFGLKVSPTDSSVNPEKFNGYHSGVDFEVTASEQDAPVSVRAICSGEVKLKKWVSGYGGLLITSCEIDDEAVTVLYGHLDLASIKYELGNSVQAGDQLGLLGAGFSPETAGERKHLHLAIHRGTAIVLSGYVASLSQLSAWLDPLEHLTKSANRLE